MASMLGEQDLASGIWSLQSGIWSLESGAWSLESEVWSLEPAWSSTGQPGTAKNIIIIDVLAKSNNFM